MKTKQITAKQMILCKCRRNQMTAKPNDSEANDSEANDSEAQFRRSTIPAKPNNAKQMTAKPNNAKQMTAKQITRSK